MSAWKAGERTSVVGCMYDPVTMVMISAVAVRSSTTPNGKKA